jgi:hypothetical protein
VVARADAIKEQRELMKANGEASKSLVPRVPRDEGGGPL